MVKLYCKALMEETTLYNSASPPLPPFPGYRIQDNKLGLTASLLAGREAKWLLPPIPSLDGKVVKVLSYPKGRWASRKRTDT